MAEEAMSERQFCDSPHPDPMRCNRPPGHEGDHEAHGFSWPAPASLLSGETRDPITSEIVGMHRAMERVEQLRTNYLLAHELADTAAWIAAHALSHGEDRPHLDRLARAISHLRGQSREPVRDIDELLRNDPWAAAIAAHVRQSIVAQQPPASTPIVSEKGVTFDAEDVELLEAQARREDSYAAWLPEGYVNGIVDEIQNNQCREKAKHLRSIANKINDLLPPSDSSRTTT